MIEEITSESDIDILYEKSKTGPVFMLKHSSTCPISAGAWRLFQEFSGNNPDIYCGRLMVREHKALSNLITERSGIRHETPQIILFSGGRPYWTASHYGISADAMARALKALNAIDEEGES